MLIKITESCHMGCSHCLSNCVPSTNHMSIDTFVDALKFCIKYDCALFGNIISGGEPTDNPNFEKFIDIYYSLYNLNTVCLVTTNGHWLINNQEKVLDMLNKYPFLFFQVTYDERYYPIKLDVDNPLFKHERIGGISIVDHIYPQGRALINNIPSDNKIITVPKCTNLKLFIAQTESHSLSDVLYNLRLKLKYSKCTPAINYDGSIGLGESNLCPRCCNIYQDEQIILNSMINSKCNKCWEYLPQDKRAMIDNIINTGKIKYN